MKHKSSLAASGGLYYGILYYSQVYYIAGKLMIGLEPDLLYVHNIAPYTIRKYTYMIYEGIYL